MNAAALLALALTLPLQTPDSGGVEGVVTAESGERIAAATVWIAGSDPALSVRTDATGRYRLRDVPAGRRTLRVEAVGYRSMDVEVRVVAGGTVTLDIVLDLRPVQLMPLDVRALSGRLPVASGESAPDVGARLPARAASRTVAAVPAIASMGFQRNGGSGEPVDPGDAIYMRGAAADLKRILLDGAPVHAPFHVAGLLPPFAPATLGAATVYVGGAPVRYEGGLAYVLDMRTRSTASAGRVRTAGEIDALAARAVVDVPAAGGMGAWASARTTHPYGVAAVAGLDVPYRYGDVLARMDIAPDREHRFRATAFWNREAVRLGSGSGAAVEWGNRAASLGYAGEFGRTSAEATAALSRFDMRVPAELTGTAERAIAGHVRLAADFRRDGGNGVAWRYGASAERLRIRPGAATPDTSSPPPDGSTEIGLGPAGDASGMAAGAYVEADWPPAAGLRVRSGMRLDRYAGSDGLRLGPRISLAWTPTDRIVLTLAGGRYHQFLPVPSVDATDRVRHDLTVAGATHLTASVVQSPVDGLVTGVEGYYKSFDNVRPESTGSDAHASGVDLWLRLARDAWSGWAGYSLEWTWALVSGPTAERFGARHLLSAGLAAPVTRIGRFSLRLALGGGLPYAGIGSMSPDAVTNTATSTVEAADRSSQFADAYRGGRWIAPPADPYLKLDAEWSRDWTVEWAGRQMMIAPYVKVLNALGDRDGIFFSANRQGGGIGEPEAIDAAPVLPVVGLRWKF